MNDFSCQYQCWEKPLKREMTFEEIEQRIIDGFPFFAVSLFILFSLSAKML